MRALPPTAETAECDKLALGGFGFDMTSGMRVEGVKRIIQYRSRGWIEIKNRELEVAHFWGRHILCCIGHYCYFPPIQLHSGRQGVKFSFCYSHTAPCTYGEVSLVLDIYLYFSSGSLAPSLWGKRLKNQRRDGTRKNDRMLRQVDKIG